MVMARLDTLEPPREAARGIQPSATVKDGFAAAWIGCAGVFHGAASYGMSDLPAPNRRII
jgi:hypothetical protein